MTSMLELKANCSLKEFSDELQRRGPVFWSEADQFWVVTDTGLAHSILKSPLFSADRSGFFMAKMPQCPFHKVANFFSVVKKMMVTSDPPHHTARRSLAAFGIADHVLEQFTPKVDQVVTTLLQQNHLQEEFDFVESLALPLPNIVLADLFSIPAEDRPNFYRWANHMTQFFGGASENIELDAENADSGAAQLKKYFTGLIAERRQHPAEDFLSHLLKNQRNLGLDDDEVISQAAIMLVAGTVTTTDQISNVMQLFLSNPAVVDQLVATPELLDSAIEEATRLDPAVNFIFRVVSVDMELDSVEVKKGQLVFVSVNAVNRDGKVFPQADSFNLTRTRRPHLSYGSGIHYCLGAKLGRIQIKILFGKLLPELALMRLGSSQRKHQSLAFTGYESLRIKTDFSAREVRL